MTTTGVYIFNLVGYDYNEADKKLKKAIENLVTIFGEEKLCSYADYLVAGQPDITLPVLLKRINHGIDFYVPTVVEDELAF